MRRPEQALQIQVANYLRVALRPPTLWTAIGHGGGGKARGAILKAMGVQPGWPDFLVMHVEVNETSGITRGLPIVVGLELKSKIGSLSAAQKAMRDKFEEIGAYYDTARSLGEVVDILQLRWIPLHARIS